MTQSVELRTRPFPTEIVERPDPAGLQAFRTLQFLFIALPIVAGADKFFHLLVNWDMYLAPIVPVITGLAPHNFMMIVGVIEIVAGIIVAVKPKLGSVIVAGWLAAIIVNLLAVPGFLDIAARDLGLMLSALALFRLSSIYKP